MKIGVIGVGVWGENHVRTLKELKHEAYISDLNKDRMKSIIKKYSVKKLTNYDLDAVIIATPSDTHYDVCKQMLKKNLNIFCEKPLTLSQKEAENLINLANGKERILAVGHIYRFTDWVKTFKRLYETIYPHKIEMISNNSAGPRKDCNILFDLSIHYLDLLEYINLGKPKIKRYELGDTYGMINLKYPHTEVLIKMAYNTTRLRSIKMDSENVNANMNLLKINNNPLKDELEHFIKCIESSTYPNNYADSRIIKLLESLN